MPTIPSLLNIIDLILSSILENSDACLNWSIARFAESIAACASDIACLYSPVLTLAVWSSCISLVLSSFASVYCERLNPLICPLRSEEHTSELQSRQYL